MANIIRRGERFSHLLALELKGSISTYGFTPKQVAEEIGISYTTLYRYFNGSRALPSDILSNACEVIGTDPEELIARAYRRLVKELGSYSPIGDADIVQLYTPSQGIPIDYDSEDHASKAAKKDPRWREETHNLSDPLVTLAALDDEHLIEDLERRSED